jgi:Tfp pilus assembly protein PilE
MKTKQTGYTLAELVFVLAFIAIIGLAGTGIYVLFHFITKFW